MRRERERERDGEMEAGGERPRTVPLRERDWRDAFEGVQIGNVRRSDEKEEELSWVGKWKMSLGLLQIEWTVSSLGTGCGLSLFVFWVSIADMIILWKVGKGTDRE